MLPTKDVLSIKLQSENKWSYNKTSPTDRKIVGKLEKKKLRRLKQMSSSISNN